MFLEKLKFSHVNNDYITVKEQLNQPQAEAYCANHYNGTLYSFEDGNVNTKVQKSTYWTGRVFNERTKTYEFGNGTKISAKGFNKPEGDTSGRKICVLANWHPSKLETSQCCISMKYFICKSPQKQPSTNGMLLFSVLFKGIWQQNFFSSNIKEQLKLYNNLFYT